MEGHTLGYSGKTLANPLSGNYRLGFDRFFQTALYSTEDLPLAECLATTGVKLTFLPLPRQHGGGYAEHIFPIPPTGDFGARFKQNADHIVLTHVFNGGSAESAALCPQDKIIALDGYACTDFAAQWADTTSGQKSISTSSVQAYCVKPS